MDNKEEAEKIWGKTLEIIQEKIGKAAYEMWAKPLVPQQYENGCLTLLSGNNLAQSYLEKHKKDILEALSSVCGKEVLYNIVYDEDLRKQLAEKAKKADKEADKEYLNNFDKRIKPSKYDSLKQMQSECRLNLKYKFENFVVGANNKLAYAAAQAAAKYPGEKYNPLFIYGGSGLGKTHLLQAIGHDILLHKPGIKVKYIKAEEFINDVVDSLAAGMDKTGDKNKKMNAFRNRYRNTDVLLIDDIQIIEGKKRTEEEMYNTFDSLYNTGKQIVFTSDRPPEAFENSPERLRTRFQQGLLADVQAPDLETRMAILKKLAEYNKTELPYDVVTFIASVYNKNIRELEGAFNKIAAAASINGMPINSETVKKIIGYSENKKPVSLETIIDTASSFYNIPVSEIRGQSREASIAKARNISAYLMREMTNESFPAIGAFFNRKHTTIMHSCDKVKTDIAFDRRTAQEIQELKDKINA